MDPQPSPPPTSPRVSILTPTGDTEYAPEIPTIESAELRYVARIGAGCFGDVFKGKCRGQEVAIKKISPTKELDPDFLHSFQMEIAVLTHPHIVQLLGACTQEGHLAIVTEFLDYGDLSQLILAKTPLTFLQKYTICHDIAAAMSWCHESVPPVIHRDLKPANLLVGRDYRVKLCDFGLSQFLVSSKLFDSKTAPGTPLWMAPEVLLGRALSDKIDVYSFAIVMWELFTYQEPFKNHNDFEAFVDAVCFKHERPDIESKKARSLIPHYIKDVIAVSWQPNPILRPTMTKLLGDLGHAMIHTLLPCEAAAAMWINAFRFQTEVLWEKFIPTFLKTLGVGEEDQFFHVECLNQLLVSTDFRGQHVVKIEKFSMLLQWFGDLLDPDRIPFTDRVVGLMQMPWFYGHTSKDDSELQLFGVDKTGAFLVRFNLRDPIASQPFTISKLTSASRKITEHQRIYYSKEKGYYVHYLDPITKKEEKIYSSGEIPNLITTAQMQLNLAVPCALSPYQNQRKSGHYIVPQSSDSSDSED